MHEQVALRDICVRAGRARSPTLEPDVWFGAWACLDLENRTARRLLDVVGRRGMTAVPARPTSSCAPADRCCCAASTWSRDEEGVEHRTTRPVSAVCRCGKSASKPWCDGTHKVLPPKLRP